MVPATGEFMRTTTSLKLVVVKQIEERLEGHEKAFQTKSVSFFWAWTIVNLGLSRCIFRKICGPLTLFFVLDIKAFFHWRLDTPERSAAFEKQALDDGFMYPSALNTLVRMCLGTQNPLAEGIGPQGLSSISQKKIQNQLC